MRVILHIGQSKTGTTALQDFLSLNQAYFIEKGILYPSAFHTGLEVKMASHNSVADALLGHKVYPGLTSDQYFDQFFSRAKTLNCHTIILSAEHFFGGQPRVWNIHEPSEYYKLYETKIRNLSKYLRGHDVEIIVYLRAQIDWVESNISQCIRISRLISEKSIYESDAQFFELLKPMTLYDQLLDIWKDVLAPSRIICRPYDKANLYKQNIIHDFFSHFDIHDLIISSKSTDLHSNISFSREYVEVKKELNKLPHNKDQERVMIDCLSRLSQQLDKIQPYCIDKELKNKIHEYCEASNLRLSQKYMDGFALYDFNQSKYQENKPELSEESIKIAREAFDKEYHSFRSFTFKCNVSLRRYIRENISPLHAFLHRLRHLFSGS